MNHPNELLQLLEKEIQHFGLLVRGVVHVSSKDREFSRIAASANSIVLIGNAGSQLWPKFKPSIDEHRDPLDRWTRKMLDPVAERLGAAALYPFERPHLPFLTWALRSEPISPSPLGLCIHPTFGPWHAYRAAFVFDQVIPATVNDHESPCATCAEKPCLDQCPVGAIRLERVDVDRCKTYLSDYRDSPCMTSGCRARAACPVGKEWEYAPEHARFHMNAFAPGDKASR